MGTNSGFPWAITLGRIAGIPIRLHLTFLLFLGYLGLRAATSNDEGQRWAGLALTLGIFVSVLLHELGHSFMARYFKMPVREIVLYPLGGVAMIQKRTTPKEELLVTFAGPLVNVLIALAIFGGLIVTSESVGMSDVGLSFNRFWQELMIANIGLFLFNMLPAFPMDGGRILRALLSYPLKHERATLIAGRIGQGMAVLFGLYGMYRQDMWLCFLAFFLFTGAQAEINMARYVQMVGTDEIVVGSAMRGDVPAASLTTTMEEATSLFTRTDISELPVVDKEVFQGVLPRDATPALGLVSDYLSQDYIAVPPQTRIRSVLFDMQSRAKTIAYVVEDGALQGVVTQESLTQFLQQQQRFTKK